jgi:hypothetical protein
MKLNFKRFTFLGKIRIVGVVVLFCSMLCSFYIGILHAQEPSPLANSWQNESFYGIDPALPTARYDLDKLNKHLIENETNKMRIAQLETKIHILEALRLDERLSKIESASESNGWLLKTVAGGIILIVLETLSKIFKVRFIKRENE